MKYPLIFCCLLFSSFSLLAQTVNISGIITTEGGDLTSCQVILTGTSNTYTASGAGGSYFFENIPANQTYQVSATKDINYLNGVTTFDNVLIARHILGIEVLDSDAKILAADANSSGSVTTLDMVTIQRLILNQIPSFPNGQSWIYIPDQSIINDFSNPNITINITGVKRGDVNTSAIP